jgi:hypothetical protein
VLDPLPLGPDGATTAVIPVTEVRVGECRGHVGGEIVSFSERTTDSTSDRRLRGGCFRAAGRFAGLDVDGRRVVAPGAPQDSRMRWIPGTAIDAHRLVPGPQERNAGRTWSACVAVPVWNTGFTGSLVDAYTTGVLPDVFGLCWDGTDLDASSTARRCDEPHSAELIATAWLPDRSLVTRVELQRNCEQVTAATLRRPDPTAGGRLSVVLDPYTSDGALTPSDPQSVGCFVTVREPDRLTGTVVGLANRPLPLEP